MKNSIRSASAITSHHGKYGRFPFTNGKPCILLAQINTLGCKLGFQQKEMGHKEGQWYSKSMMCAFYVLQYAKRHISGQSNVEQWKNQAQSLIRYRVTLDWRHHAGISGKFHWITFKKIVATYWTYLGLYWRHFWAWLFLTNVIPTNTAKAPGPVWYCQAWFWVTFSARKAQTTMIPNIQYYLIVW